MYVYKLLFIPKIENAFLNSSNAYSCEVKLHTTLHTYLHNVHVYTLYMYMYTYMHVRITQYFGLVFCTKAMYVYDNTVGRITDTVA
jgi:hypothetical protein